MKNLEQLNRIYSEAEESDRELFAEQRSNVLLIAGEHYNRINFRIASQVRQTNRTSTSEQKLRLTKNHLHKISRAYTTHILSESPGVTVLPQVDTDLQDKKDADLNLAVLKDIKYRKKFKKKTQAWCKQFVGIGEVCVKIFWDSMAGEFLGYEQKVDEDGEPIFDGDSDRTDPNTGEEIRIPVPDNTRPVFTGDIVFEEVLGFNLLREHGTEDMDDPGKAWIVRKMMKASVLRERYAGDEKKISGIRDSSDRTYVVFDYNKGNYNKKKGEVLLREYYWKPSEEHPKGYFVFATDTVILEEGELPGGLFPLCWAGFDVYPTSPRGKSIIKVARPYQAEINRASSSMATAQVTMGDDKILYSAGSKLAPGALLPGVRGISVTGGQAPQILPGRSGAQYLDYVSQQTSEMYNVVMLEETEVLDKSGQLEAHALLFKSATQRQKFSPYTETFEGFLVDVAEVALQTCKNHMPEDMVIQAVGSRERINIQEFRDTLPLSYTVRIEPGNETLETKFGKQLTFQHALQYVGKQMDNQTIGKILKNMPFGNLAEGFEDLTLDEDIANDDMLAIERGEPVQASPYVPPEYMIKKFTGRMKKSDFKFLHPQVQQGYQDIVQQYEQVVQKNAQAAIAAKNEFIPVDGVLVTCDFYVENPTKPDAPAKRAKIPQRSIEWLIQKMEQQGASLDKIENMNSKSLQELAENLGAGQPQPVEQPVPQQY